MGIFKDLEKTLSGLVLDLKPAPEPPADYVPFKSMDFDRSSTCFWTTTFKAVTTEQRTTTNNL